MAKASHLRSINQRQIIQAMLRLRRTSRTQLGIMAGMSQPTVSRIVEQLLADQVLREMDSPEGPASVGRPSKLLGLDDLRRRFAIIELDVKQTRLVAAALAIPETDHWPIVFPTPSTAASWESAIHSAWRKLKAPGLEAVVLSVPGVVEERTGRVLLSPNVRWTEGVDFSQLFKSICPAPLLCVQEIRALAMGQLAVEPEVRDFLLVDSGSGVGAAAVVGGKLYEGAVPLSGELGHTPVRGNRRQCGCGAVGCVETLVSRAGLLCSSQEHGGVGTWTELLHEVREHGLPPWLRSSLDALALTVAGAVNVLGVRQVMFTGIFTELPPAAGDYLCRQVSRGAMWARFGEVTCRTAPRRRLAGLVSAAIDRVLLAENP